MPPRPAKWPLLLAAGSALYALACRRFPAFDRFALRVLALPALAGLHRLTAPLPFPLAEPAALALAGASAFALLRALALALARRSPRPLGRWLRGMALTALLAAAGLCLLWAPALARPARRLPDPGPARLEGLCRDLITTLNRSGLAFPDAGATLAAAPAAAGLPGGAVKAARYPEWMAPAGIRGLFVPLTGEALVDPETPAPLLPFTAVHELEHLRGVADEGAANIAAWRRCQLAGGPFADSADLWALRYALGLLRLRDEAAWVRVRATMGEPLRRACAACGEEADSRGRYAQLAVWLAWRYSSG